MASYYLKKLKEDFSRKKRANSYYSLRAYARDLGVHPATLCQVLLGKRPLPLKNAGRVVERMALNARERTVFMDSLSRRHSTFDAIKVPEKDERFLLDESYFQIIAEWEHYAVLALFDCYGFDTEITNISERLKITPTRADVVLENLLHYGLLKRDESGKLLKSHPKVRTSEDVLSKALRASHMETLEIGKSKLDDVSVELRDFSSVMVAIDLNKIPEIKIAIREFRQKLMELVKSGRPAEVYQLAIQFYPISEKRRTKSRGKNEK
jgi:uncharacterized protein (TIGR02147 family)